MTSYNLGQGSSESSSTEKYLSEVNSDIVILQEYTDSWRMILEQLFDQYRFAVTEPREDAFGIALLSRLPINESTVQQFPNSNIPYVLANVRISNHTLWIMGVHLQ